LRRVEQLRSALEEKERELESAREEKERISDRLGEINDAIADSNPPVILHESETGSSVNERVRAFDEVGVLKRLKWRVFGMPEDADE
jgi:predicted  nucleic acid-binding Zn-ribbon protein